MSTNLPSFERAEYLPAPGAPHVDRCHVCRTEIAGRYYRINGEMACEGCALQAEPVRIPDSHKAFTKALLWGAGAAFVGMIGYALFTILTGLYIGYVAIGVGYLVGKAIKRGSGGRGGKRYQIAAVLLTYAAVSVAAIPILINASIKAKKAKVVVTNNQASKDFPYPGDAPKEKPAPTPAASKAPMSFGAWLALALALGLASPFLELAAGFQGMIGLLILIFGMMAAWKETAGTEAGAPSIEGPYEASPA